MTSKSLMEMLENTIKKYQNKILTAAEVIEELIEIAKEIQKGLLFFKPSTTWRTSLKHHLPFRFFFSH